MDYLFGSCKSYVRGPGRQCPICGWKGREFLPLMVFHAAVVRPKAMCPKCGSLERHRCYFLFYMDFFKTVAPGPRETILHFAWEKCLAPLLSSHAAKYMKSNFPEGQVGDHILDLTQLNLPDESVDLIVLNRVLSCMRPDREAIAEMYRVLKKGAYVLAGDPVNTQDETKEFPTVLYGGACRGYGLRDLPARFQPFELRVWQAHSQLEETKRRLYGIDAFESLMILKKADMA
jgi:SAM-dependent methyltransferase